MSGGCGSFAETFIASTVVYCHSCNRTELASIVSLGKSGVFLRKDCSENGTVDIKLAADESWYMERCLGSQQVRKPAIATASKNSCPMDCGPCERHNNDLHLPVFSITNDCNLDCPICFTHNRPDKKYFKTVDETEQIVAHLLAQKPCLEVINLTGGEPTLHPDFFDIVNVCQRSEIRRITVNTNGLRVAADEAFAAAIKEADIQMVLSLNSFDGDKNIKIHGRDIGEDKRRALAMFEKYDIPVTLLMVAIKGINEIDIAQIASTYLKQKFVKNIVIQNMTYTGANGSLFQPRAHITIDEVEAVLATQNDFSPEHFFPLGSAHPLCYSVAYYLCCDDRLISLSRIIPKGRLVAMTGTSYLLSDHEDLHNLFLDGINRLWAEGEDETVLATLKSFIRRLYPPDRHLTAMEREVVAAEMVKTVYIHSHMDEDNFDVDRVSRCADLVPDESGRLIPACSYNLIYREQDERFWKK